MTSTPYQQISQHMDTHHPGITYLFGPDGVLIDQAIHTEWGGGVTHDFKGLVVKYLRPGTRLKKKDGSWVSDQIAVQAAALDKLVDTGYVAQFAVGLEEFAQLVQSYLEGSS